MNTHLTMEYPPLEALPIDWEVVTPKLQERWSRLTEDDLTGLNRNVDLLVGKLVARHQMTPDEARRELDTFLRGFEPR